MASSRFSRRATTATLSLLLSAIRARIRSLRGIKISEAEQPEAIASSSELGVPALVDVVPVVPEGADGADVVGVAVEGSTLSGSREPQSRMVPQPGVVAGWGRRASRPGRPGRAWMSKKKL